VEERTPKGKKVGGRRLHNALSERTVRTAKAPARLGKGPGPTVRGGEGIERAALGDVRIDDGQYPNAQCLLPGDDFLARPAGIPLGVPGRGGYGLQSPHDARDAQAGTPRVIPGDVRRCVIAVVRSAVAWMGRARAFHRQSVHSVSTNWSVKYCWQRRICA